MEKQSVLGSASNVSALLAPEGLLATSSLAAGVGDERKILSQEATGAGSSGDSPPAKGQIETAWAQAHPGGETSVQSNGSLLLWNFDVGSEELKPEHVSALNQHFRVNALTGMTASDITASGGASNTGGLEANRKLALRRAESVAAWIAQYGLPGIQTSAIVPASKMDGESMARDRCVLVVNSKYQPPHERSEPNDWQFLPGTTSDGGPISVRYGARNDMDFDLGPIKFFTVPPNGYLEGDFSFTGTIRVTFRDKNAFLTAQLGLNALKDTASLKITKQISDALALRVGGTQFGTVKAGQVQLNSKFTLSALIGENTSAWEFGVQQDKNYFYAKSPKTPLIALSGKGDNLGGFTWENGTSVSVQLLGQFQFAGRAGPKLIEDLMAWIKPLALPAAEAALLLSSIAMTAAVFYFTLSAAIESEQEGMRQAGVLARRMGFAAQLGVIVSTGATNRDADDYLSGWESLPKTLPLVKQSRRDAVAQLAALGDRQEAKKDQLRKSYAADSAGTALAYREVVRQITNKLGGYDLKVDAPPQILSL